jgi:HAD superfamily hydrolase (TIGR01450 family)
VSDHADGGTEERPRYTGVICDLDGTVYRSGRPFPGVVEALERLRAAGVRVLFVSNNPLQNAEAYATKLSALGIPVTPDDVLTSGAVMASWLREHTPNARVLLLGEESLREELAQVGVKVVHRGLEADVVVASFDRTFTYDKWLEAFRALRAGARFVATNPDPTCPVEGGEIPDCGGIIAALEATSGRRVEAVAGKPSSLMLAAALARLGKGPDEVVVVGDRPGTDLALGHQGGVDTALVLTGVTTPSESEHVDPRPVYVLGSLAELPSVVLGR